MTIQENIQNKNICITTTGNTITYKLDNKEYTITPEINSDVTPDMVGEYIKFGIELRELIDKSNDDTIDFNSLSSKYVNIKNDTKVQKILGSDEKTKYDITRLLNEYSKPVDSGGKRKYGKSKRRGGKKSSRTAKKQRK